jgi:hypothetical protein
MVIPTLWSHIPTCFRCSCNCCWTETICSQTQRSFSGVLAFMDDMARVNRMTLLSSQASMTLEACGRASSYPPLSIVSSGNAGKSRESCFEEETIKRHATHRVVEAQHATIITAQQAASSHVQPCSGLKAKRQTVQVPFKQPGAWSPRRANRPQHLQPWQRTWRFFW